MINKEEGQMPLFFLGGEVKKVFVYLVFAMSS